jgi:peptidyl-prolyl cis-trans isomerase B (cyclophilin B)
MRIVCKKLCFPAALLSLIVLAQAPAATPAQTVNPAYARILDFERTRSLGGGALAAYTDDPDSAVAARAALALGRTRLAGARPALIHCLAKPAPSVRAMCAYGLGLIASSLDRATLGPFANDSEPAVRYAVADALGRIALANPAVAGEAAADVVLGMATRDGDPVVRGHAALALGAFAKSPAAAHLPAALATAFASESDADVRGRLMFVLARDFALAAPAATLQAGLKDGDPFVRAAAVRALGRRKNDPSSAALVRPMLDDSAWQVQFEARQALLALDGKERDEHLAAIPAGVHVPALPPSLGNQSPAPSTLPPAPKLSPPPADAVLALPLAVTGSASMRGEPAARAGRPRVRIVTTKGAVTLALYADWAPYTVANFLSLARQGYFDGNRWFRIVPDFVVQTGDRTNTGEGDAGYTIPGELNPIEQTSGIISMGLDYDAKSPIDSGGTQFYLTLSPQYHLDNLFTVFGKVVDGFDVLPNLVVSDTIVRVEIL